MNKKIIAPIVITIIVILYYILYFGIIITLVSGIWKLILGIIPIILITLMVYTCIERIKEIKGGEEDGLSKY